MHTHIRKTLKLSGQLTRPEVKFDAKSQTALQWAVQFMKRASPSGKLAPSNSAIMRRAIQLYAQRLQALPGGAEVRSEFNCLRQASDVSPLSRAAWEAVLGRLDAAEGAEALPSFAQVWDGPRA